MSDTPQHVGGVLGVAATVGHLVPASALWVTIGSLTGAAFAHEGAVALGLQGTDTFGGLMGPTALLGGGVTGGLILHQIKLLLVALLQAFTTFGAESAALVGRFLDILEKASPAFADLAAAVREGRTLRLEVVHIQAGGEHTRDDPERTDPGDRGDRHRRAA